MERYEQSVVAGYLANFLRSRPLDRPSLRHVGEWLEEMSHSSQLGQIEGVAPFIELANKRGITDSVAQAQRLVNRTLLPSIDKHRVRLSRAPLGTRERNLRALCRSVALDPSDAAILGFFVRYAVSPVVEGFADVLSRTIIATHLVPALLGISHREFVRRADNGSPVCSSGLLRVNLRRDAPQVAHIATVLDRVLGAVEAADGTAANIRHFLLGEPRSASLQWEDFAFLGDVRDRLAAFLARATADRLTGVNILFYGPPGTGKTEFAKTLAARVGLSLYAVGEADSEGAEPNRQERITSLRLFQGLARQQKKAVLLFDEMDDAFSESRGFMSPAPRVGFSKVFTNRMLENNPVPTLWIANDPSLMDEALIRRMGFALEIKVPPLAAREKVWGRILLNHGVQLEATEVREMARHEGVAPAVVESAVRFGKLVGGSAADIREAAQSIVKAMTGHAGKPKDLPAQPFNLALANPDLDLTRLAHRLAGDASRTFSLCLYGPPGTGKSAFVRDLAGRLGMEVLMKRASDLLGPYVGQTEQNIARAFGQAREEGSFLVFDEADSFLGDRNRAVRSWEVSHVNEMLTWMESHPLPFACTTNLMEILDEASLRRFTFKVRFDYLRREQVAEAFRFFFGAEAPDSALEVRCLTPGDFTVTRRKAEVLGMLGDPIQLAMLLAKEAEVKRDKPRMVGFAAATPLAIPVAS